MIAERVSARLLASVQPVVLVGGRSRRFGRDKLREPWGDGRVLVQRPIETLRAVFDRRVLLVGECHPSIVPLADGVIPDEHPGIGPMGGIASALKWCEGPVFVLAGDMPDFTADDVRLILAAAGSNPRAAGVLAMSDRLHPCVGMYTEAALPILTDCIRRGCYKLWTAFPDGLTVVVPVAVASTKNINLCTDLG